MSQENMPDSDIWKHHQIIETKEYDFYFDESEEMDAIRYLDHSNKSYKRIYVDHVNVYIMNDEGKTINSFQPKPRKPEYGDRLRSLLNNYDNNALYIDYATTFFQQYNMLLSRIDNKILSTNNLNELYQHLVINISGPRQSGKTEFCLELNRKYNCVNIIDEEKIKLKPQFMKYLCVNPCNLENTIQEEEIYNNVKFIVIDDASLYSKSIIDKVLIWAFENYDTQPFIVLVG